MVYMRNQLSMDSLVLITLCSPLLKRENVMTRKQYYQLEQRVRKSSIKSVMHLLNSTKDDLIHKIKSSNEEADLLLDLLSDFLFIIKTLITYERQHIYITTIYEDNYPRILKERLKKKAPLFLFHSDNYHLVNQPLVSLFGPISVNKRLKENIKIITNQLDKENYTFIGGYTKGSERAALEKQLENGGTVVLFTANKFAYLRKKYMNYIKQGKLLIISHQDIDASYDVAEIIETNNYIYALSYVTIIVSTQYNSGIVWFNAVQNIKEKWCSMIVLIDEEFYGNAKLVELGAVAFTIEQIESGISIDDLVNQNYYLELEKIELEQLSIFEFINDERIEDLYVN